MNSPLSYIGGKSKLAKTIISMLPEHEAYCEVFAGAGWVFFNKEPSKYEIINDLDSELITFYRVLYSVSKGQNMEGKELLIKNF